LSDRDGDGCSLVHKADQGRASLSCVMPAISASVPILVLNQGRQKLYGNIGFWLIEANVQSLMRTPTSDDVSWC
jgi:hypothetical protein